MKTVFLTIVVALFFVACNKSEKVYGTNKTTENKTTLTELLESPAKFHKKEVTLTGFVESQCGSRCDFVFREGNQIAKISMGEIEAPVMKQGTPVTVTTTVYSGERKVVLTAKNFTLGKAGN